MDILLTDIEVRILGCLLEKSMTTPEHYPLSLNALTNACNQKSNRQPVVDLPETTVVRGLEGLRDKQLVITRASGRVPKYAEILVDTRNLVAREAALLMVMLLRGPQTIGELRTRTERAHRFTDLAGVESALADLVDSGYVKKLPRLPGRKEPRFVHLFAGEPEQDSIQTAPPENATLEVMAENERIAQLEQDLTALQSEFNAFKADFIAFKKEFE